MNYDAQKLAGMLGIEPGLPDLPAMHGAIHYTLTAVRLHHCMQHP